MILSVASVFSVVKSLVYQPTTAPSLRGSVPPWRTPVLRVAADDLRAADGDAGASGHEAELVAAGLQFAGGVRVDALLQQHLVVAHHEAQGVDGLLWVHAVVHHVAD